MSNILKGIILTEAVDQSWIQAYKALEANGGEPDSTKPTLFIKQLAMLANDAGISSLFIPDFVKQYVSDSQRANQIVNLVRKAIEQAPGMSDMKKYSQQSQADDTSFAQQQTIGQLQHELSAQQLINQSNLEKADAEQLVQMDANARVAIQSMKQELALDAKERLHKLQMEIDATAERKEIRDHELKLAQAGYDHEVNVINVRAEGEYKKAKLEADYQKARSTNKAVPPGFHAHLGYLYFKAGKDDQAFQSFQTEKALFPESGVYMDRILSKAKK
jgi:hypothetical protein